VSTACAEKAHHGVRIIRAADITVRTMTKRKADPATRASDRGCNGWLDTFIDLLGRYEP
jgi:hypothetical protein